MVKFCVDKSVDGKPYPNVATWNARPYTSDWRKFSTNWPYSEPVHFFEYLDQENIPYQIVDWTQSDRSTLYPISLSFFDFGIDWFVLLPVMIREKLRSRNITLWFFYSEGDHPGRIQDHLHAQFQKYDIDLGLIQFTSANSAADQLSGFHYFVDDECLYRLRNTNCPIKFHDRPRSHKYTALVRTHKWWRATTMARIWALGLHNHGFFSYNHDLSVEDKETDNPIEIDRFDNLRANTYEFLQHCPFRADELSSQEHNLYANTVVEHFEDSYLNVVLETHLDADQSGGVFLTEKTFKPIKHCQLFMIFGARGSIAQLRNMGYDTFDHVIDHSYDVIENNTERWDQACKEFERLMRTDLHSIYIGCKSALEHNQQLFLSSKANCLNNLLKRSLEICNHL